MNALSPLARYARPARREPAGDGPVCHLCGAPAGDVHRHVVDLERRAVRCACATCALLFTDSAAAGGRLRTVPDRVLADARAALDQDDWGALQIPVGLAFVFFSSSAQRWIAIYPSPAGAMESELSLDAWDAVAARSALLRETRPDVEAILVRGERGTKRLEILLVPIDACYDLVGRIRRSWRGFDGGPDARREIDAFFEALRARARPFPRTSAAGGPE